MLSEAVLSRLWLDEGVDVKCTHVGEREKVSDGVGLKNVAEAVGVAVMDSVSLSETVR